MERTRRKEAKEEGDKESTKSRGRRESLQYALGETRGYFKESRFKK